MFRSGATRTTSRPTTLLLEVTVPAMHRFIVTNRSIIRFKLADAGRPGRRTDYLFRSVRSTWARSVVGILEGGLAIFVERADAFGAIGMDG
jgi:hypothetical protein